METPHLSFIGIVDFSQEAKWLYMTDSVADLLGYEPYELIGRPSLELVHPDELERVAQLHYDTIRQDQAAVLCYLRMRHKVPLKGYILCGISRTVVHNVLVGSVSFACLGAKALHNASTAQEVKVISATEIALGLDFRRWHDASPMPPSPNLRPVAIPSSPTQSVSSWSSSSRRGSRSPSPYDTSPSPTLEKQRGGSITFDYLPSQSFRTAFILNRFSSNCTISYCSNDLLISTTTCIGRPFFDFVSKKYEDIVRSWIDCVKGWGVNERGQPSDGGFGFGRFYLLTEGRDSIGRAPEPLTQSRRDRGGSGADGKRAGRANGSRSHAALNPGRKKCSPPSDTDSPQQSVDAIFSAHSDGLMVILRRSI